MNREGWLKPYFKSYFWRFTGIVLLGMLTILTASMLMFTSGFLISKSALRPENILMVYVPIVGVRTFGISRSVVHYVERLVGHDAVLRILSKMRVRLYRILEPQALSIRSRYRTGDILGVLAEDIENLQNVYIRTVFPGIIALFMYILTIIAVGRFDVTFACLAAVYIFVLIFVLPMVSLWITRARHRRLKQERKVLYQKLTDAVMGISDWVISGRSAQFVDSYEADEARVTAIERSLRTWARWRGLLGQLMVGLVVVSAVYWSGQQYAKGAIDATLIAAFVLVVFPLMDAFLPISEAVERVPQYQDSLERLNQISGHEEVKAQQNPVAEEVLHEAKKSAHIKLSDVSFGYGGVRDAALSLEGVNLDIPQGKRIAIIGRSGAGKSTLLKLIQGVLTPSAGTVTINGTQTEKFGDEMSHVIAVLNQSPHLFDTTVGNNIRLGKLDATEDEVRQAGEAAKLGSLISALPEGYHTPMRETGQRFSGGERQRVALARILLQNTPVVILDEPTVGLDPQTERELLATIFEATQGKTMLWVTHHLTLAQQMDEIIFVDKGRIEMRGTHAELMATSPRYRRLYELDQPE